jgi:hypothetical protein
VCSLIQENTGIGRVVSVTGQAQSQRSGQGAGNDAVGVCLHVIDHLLPDATAVIELFGEQEGLGVVEIHRQDMDNDCSPQSTQLHGGLVFVRAAGQHDTQPNRITIDPPQRLSLQGWRHLV